MEKSLSILQQKHRKSIYLVYHLKNHPRRNLLLKLYQPLFESNFSFGIIHWGSSHHTKPIRIIQNKICKSIRRLDKRTSESVISEEMGRNGKKCENLYKNRVALFVFKNRLAFQIQNNEAYFSRRGNVSATYPPFEETPCTNSAAL